MDLAPPLALVSPPPWQTLAEPAGDAAEDVLAAAGGPAGLGQQRVEAKGGRTVAPADPLQHRQGTGGAGEIGELLDIKPGDGGPEAVAETGSRSVVQCLEGGAPGRCRAATGLRRPLERRQRQREHGAETAAAALAEGGIGEVDRLQRQPAPPQQPQKAVGGLARQQVPGCQMHSQRQAAEGLHQREQRGIGRRLRPQLPAELFQRGRFVEGPQRDRAPIGAGGERAEFGR